MHPRPRAVPTNQRYPNCLGPYLTNITNAVYNSPVPDRKTTLDSVKSMAAAEAWDAALLRDPTWVLGSAAAWMSAMPMRSRWQLPLRLRLRWQWQWQWASALVCLPH